MMGLLAVVMAGCGGANDNDAWADLSIVVELPDRGNIEYQVTCHTENATVTPDDAGIDGEAACLALESSAVGARLVDGPPTDLVCAQVFGGPETATIVGTINGRAVDTTVNRANGCGVADWDQLLVAVLPPAAGAG